jgi:hypothetical protein
LRRYCNRLQELGKMTDLSREHLLKKLGVAQAESERVERWV